MPTRLSASNCTRTGASATDCAHDSNPLTSPGARLAPGAPPDVVIFRLYCDSIVCTVDEVETAPLNPTQPAKPALTAAVTVWLLLTSFLLQYAVPVAAPPTMQ